MKNGKIMILSAGIGLALVLFVGCGEHSGEKEYNKAMDAWKHGDLVRARSLFEKSIRKTSGNEKKSQALNQLGLILWELDETEAAADAFSSSCNLAETLTGANLNMGIALFHAGRTDEAEVALNNVLGENPKNQTAMAMLGLIEIRKRNWTGASKELSKIVSLDPRSPAGQNALALAELHQSKNSEAAIKRLKQITSTHPDYAPAAFNLAVIYDLWLHNKRAATNWYQHYLQTAETDGKHTDAANQAMARLSGQSQATTTTPRADPDAAVRFMAEGSRLHGAKKYAEAIVQYQKAAQADPRQKNTYYNMGLSFYAQKKYTDSARACAGALRIDPLFADARYMLSLSYFQLKKWNDAEREAKELGKLDAARGKEMLNYISDARKR